MVATVPVRPYRSAGDGPTLESMETCARCGAARTSDVEWCTLCLTRFETPKAQDQDGVVMVVQSGSGIGLSLPWWCNVIVTIMVIAGGALIIVGFSPWAELGTPVLALAVVLLTIYSAVGSLLVARTWSPETFKNEEHIVVLDQKHVDAVEERQASLIVRDTG